MRHVILFAIAMLLSLQSAFSQKIDPGGHDFKKTVRGIGQIYYNDKLFFEKIFFGRPNSPLEFFVGSIKAQGGLRLYKDRLDERDWKLEIIPVADYRDLEYDVKDDLKRLAIPATYALRRPETTIFSVPHLGQILYDKTVALIDNFEATGKEGGDDGYSVTFRCVVGDEVWSLWIHNPDGRAEQLSDLFLRIIGDAAADRFDEREYVRMAGNIVF
jgi:hypothetical protein